MSKTLEKNSDKVAWALCQCSVAELQASAQHGELSVSVAKWAWLIWRDKECND